MTAVSLKCVRKSFGAAAVLKDVVLDIRPGEFLTLLGPSGCGKSTLLRIIAGLEQQDHGEVWIDGRRVDGLAPRERDIAMVFQSYALYPHLSVRQNLAMPLEMRRLSALQRLPWIGRWLARSSSAARAIEAEVTEVASALQLSALLDRRPAELSGGQRQRVALGRAMVRRPTVFLMDEPLSNLDAQLRARTRLEISALHRRLGATFVYVTHDQLEAMTMSGRVAVMFDGRIVQLGTPAEIYDAPADVRVARFLGSPEINLLPAMARAGQLEVFGCQLNVLGPPRLEGAVTVGVRAENLALARSSGGALLSGHVRAVENLGSDLMVTLELECDSADRPCITARIPPRAASSLEVGRVAHLHAEAQHLLLFDSAGIAAGRCVEAVEAAPA